MTSQSIETVQRYHERSKHRPERYARGPGYMDWANQPDSFRRFAGARLIPLDEVPATAQPAYAALFGSAAITPRPVDRAAISQLFYDSLALSAWKATGQTRWSLRVNPSSGDLHPTEGYLIAGPIDGLTGQAGVFHYAPYEHALEERYQLSPALWQMLARGLPDAGLLVGLTSIYWREAWKYGERAFRYCQHDVGHAIAAVTIAARVLGWRTVLLEQPADAAIAALLGVDCQHGSEAEHPECLLAILPGAAAEGLRRTRAWDLPAALTDALGVLAPAGRPNRLSRDHHPWAEIDRVEMATVRTGLPEAELGEHPEGTASLPVVSHPGLSARRIIRQRRSALAMDGQTGIPCDTFYRMLSSVLPDANPVVFHALPWRPCVHLAVLVHRVQGLAPGLYLLVRDAAARERLEEAITGDFVREETAPPALGLYRLQSGDFREAARIVSCRQDIAADGAFALGMLAEFEAPLAAHGAWFYKRLYWECGVIGQVLYLEAEAAGIRSTGIGCFFDDLMHGVLGLRGCRFQSLYHFTVGGPVEDPRLRTEPAYAHRQV
jgi:SagB-type dehydrogenase family enzyme